VCEEINIFAGRCGEIKKKKGIRGYNASYEIIMGALEGRWMDGWMDGRRTTKNIK
jgi:hypothetical protein